MMNITIAVRKKTMTARPEGVLAIVNNDYDQVWVNDDGSTVTNVSRNTRNGVAYGAPSGKAVPATARFVDDRFVVFDCPLQHWIHELCSERLPAGVTEKQKGDWFRSCFRDNVWMSNFAGTWTREDCINKTLTGSGFPQLQPMATGGDLLKVAGSRRFSGTECYLIEAINPLVEYRIYHPDTHRWLFFEPKLSARYWVEQEPIDDGHPNKTAPRQEWYQEPMHFYAENTVMAVFGFIPDERSSTGWVNAIPQQRCRILGADEAVPNPYIMRYGRMRANPYVWESV
jgi:hypothetical protein